MSANENPQPPQRPGKSKPKRKLPRIVVIPVLGAVAFVLAAVGFLAWLLVPGGQVIPDLSAPPDASPSEQMRALMENCLIPGGQTPVRSFLLYAENRTTGLIV